MNAIKNRALISKAVENANSRKTPEKSTIENLNVEKELNFEHYECVLGICNMKIYKKARIPLK